MSCNAWNHRPDCDCGWGGQGFFHGTDSEGLKWPLYGGGVLSKNAHCPVCGELVYFYQSPTGGRVFFDEVGAPWPKHPCTAASQPNEIPNSIYWKLEPLFLRFLKSVPFDILVKSNKAEEQWALERLLRQVRHGQYRPTLAVWVVMLPASIFPEDFQYDGGVKRLQMVDFACRIVEYMKSAPRKKWYNLCNEVAKELLRINSETEMAREIKGEELPKHGQTS